MLNDILHRPRRLRRNAHLRNLLSDTELKINHLVQPYFLTESSKSKEPIAGFTDVYRWGVEVLSHRIESDLERGLQNFLLFGHVSDSKRNSLGTEAYEEMGAMPEALRKLRTRFGQNAVFFVDVCLCPFTDHGHCGVVDKEQVLNDASLEYLSKAAMVYARAGADFVAPSDMMDGRVGVIRRLLDQQGFTDTGILAYTAKYASSYYGPFREALGSSPKQMDRSSYQMDFRNTRDALRELELDVAEGADIVMVKPALAYLDIISLFKNNTSLPVAAYSVSGEYEMVKRLAAAGMVDERKMAIENLTAIRRAGAQVVISYFGSEIAEKGWLK